MEVNKFVLKQESSPYMIFVFIVVPMLLYVNFDSFKSSNFDGLVSFNLLMILSLSVIIYVNLAYKIEIKENTITMYYFFNNKVELNIKDIKLIQKENDLQKSRAFIRVAIYTKLENPPTNFIDISLKHFKLNDIKKLLQIIKEQRPDLEIPKL